VTVTAEFGRAQHLEEVLKLVQAKVPAAQRNTIAAFIQRYYGQVDPEDLAERAPADLYGAALSHWNFARRRDPAHARVRVFNPSIEEHGWQSTHTIIEIVNDDMPFLVDSVTMEVNRHGLTLHLIIHPIVAVVRDADGTLTGVADDAEGARRESMIHVEVDRIVDPAKLDELGADIVRVLDDVRAAVEDWKKMRERVGAILEENQKRPPLLPADELAEGRAFLSWRR
jgi:glutamate dehydrogenase